VIDIWYYWPKKRVFAFSASRQVGSEFAISGRRRAKSPATPARTRSRKVHRREEGRVAPVDLAPAQYRCDAPARRIPSAHRALARCHGHGHQGRAQALCFRDAGWRVAVGTRDGASHARLADGFAAQSRPKPRGAPRTLRSSRPTKRSRRSPD
jgi:hypothetical protein